MLSKLSYGEVLLTRLNVGLCLPIRDRLHTVTSEPLEPMLSHRLGMKPVPPAHKANALSSVVNMNSKKRNKITNNFTKIKVCSQCYPPSHSVRCQECIRVALCSHLLTCESQPRPLWASGTSWQFPVTSGTPTMFPVVSLWTLLVLSSVAVLG